MLACVRPDSWPIFSPPSEGQTYSIPDRKSILPIDLPAILKVLSSSAISCWCSHEPDRELVSGSIMVIQWQVATTKNYYGEKLIDHLRGYVLLEHRG